MDFTNLNKAYPKDLYSIPWIDLLVDSTASHELLSFMDAYSWYNQIEMYEPDIYLYEPAMEATSIVIDQCMYCYKVMPFNLKNAGVTYQRLVN